jgi:hypothetical protein
MGRGGVLFFYERGVGPLLILTQFDHIVLLAPSLACARELVRQGMRQSSNTATRV